MKGGSLAARTPPAKPAESWARMREEVRALIRAEVARFLPRDEARHPLELIIESFVRCTQGESGPIVTVIDRSGEPRMIERNGKQEPFTLADLVEELRAEHPAMFHRARKEPQDNSTAETQEAEPETGQVKMPASRDWLRVSAHEPEPARAPAPAAREEQHIPFVAEPPLFSRQRLMPLLARFRLIAAAAVVMGVGTVVGLALKPWRSTPPAPATTRVAEPAQTAAATQNETPRAPTTSSPSEAADRAPVESQAARRDRVLRGAPDVIDTATLSLGGEVVRLFGVEWAPGGGRAEDLSRYLQGREVLCEPAGAADVYRCRVGGQDLSRVVLFNGGGKPTPEATPDLISAADRARESRIGVWSESAGR